MGKRKKSPVAAYPDGTAKESKASAAAASSSTTLAQRKLSFFGHLQAGKNPHNTVAHSSGSVPDLSFVTQTNRRREAYENQDRIAYLPLSKVPFDVFKQSVKTRLAQLTNPSKITLDDLKTLNTLHQLAQKMGSTFALAACSEKKDGKTTVWGASIGDSRVFVVRIPKNPKKHPVIVIPLYKYDGNLRSADERARVAAHWEAMNPHEEKPLHKNCPKPGFGLVQGQYRMMHQDKRYTINLARSLGDANFPYLLREPDEVETEITESPDYDDMLMFCSDGTFERNPPLTMNVSDAKLLEFMINRFLFFNEGANITDPLDREKLIKHLCTLARAENSFDDLSVLAALLGSSKTVFGYDGHGGDRYADLCCKWFTDKIIQDCGLTFDLSQSSDSDAETTVLTDPGCEDQTQQVAQTDAPTEDAPRDAAASSDSNRKCTM